MVRNNKINQKIVSRFYKAKEIKWSILALKAQRIIINFKNQSQNYNVKKTYQKP